jgi:integrase
MGRPAKYAEPALREKPGGIWEVVWQDRITGEKKRKTTGTKDKVQAEAFRRKLEGDLLTPKDQSPLLSYLIDKYLQNLARTKPDRNHVPAENSLRPVKAHLGHLTADQLSQDHVDDYARWRRTNRRWDGHKGFEGKDTGTIAESTINKDLRMLRACINDSAARRYIKTAVKFRNPASAGTGRDQWLTQAEVIRMLEVCEKSDRITDESGKVVWRQRNREHLMAFILISATTAARKEAVLSLTWDQVHLPRQQDHDTRVFDLGSGPVKALALTVAD